MEGGWEGGREGVNKLDCTSLPTSAASIGKEARERKREEEKTRRRQAGREGERVGRRDVLLAFHGIENPAIGEGPMEEEANWPGSRGGGRWWA